MLLVVVIMSDSNVNAAVAEVTDDELADMVECLTFSIGSEFFGVEILRVREIRAWEEVTSIPNAPEYVMGIFNLRGEIVPIYDLRLRLGMEFRDYVKETVVIVLRAQGHNGERSIGIAVDEVSDVFLIDREEIKEAPDFGSKLNSELIQGIADADGRMITMLHVDMLQPPEQRVDAVAGSGNV